MTSFHFQNWLYITPTTLHQRGGQSTHVVQFCEALVRKAQVTLLAPAASDFVAPAGTRHIRVNLPRYARGLAFELSMLPRLIAHSLDRLPDLVYVRAGIFNSAALLFAQRYHLPCLLEINGDLVDEFPTEHPATTAAAKLMMRIRLALYYASLRWSYHTANGLVVVTSDLHTMAVQRYGVPEAQVRVIPNGANVYTFAPFQTHVCQQRVGLPPHRRYVGYVGSLTTWQDIPSLLQAFATIAERHPSVDLVIVGDGIMREQIVQQCQQMGIVQRVHMTGVVPHDQVPLYLNACDIAVVPKKRGRTDSPLKIYEALSCGVPVLASAQPGVEVLSQHDAGLLYPPEDVDYLARQLDYMLSLPREDLVQMGARARRAIEQSHSWDAVVERVVTFAEEVA